MSETDHTKEFEMRDATIPFFETKKELYAYIDELVNMEHDYGTCVYAMSSAAVAAFNYVAGRLGCTGFQASMADLDILRRTRSIKGPFRITNYENLLYPQYCTEEHFPSIDTLINKNIKWLAEQAKIKLETVESPHTNVKSHWEWLVNLHAGLEAAKEETITEEDKEG